ncbi:hypothetical protein QIU18_05425 [Capnocytophaga canimorsus]|nr:hypothetical protein [Capnocytophaga canimorsus]WGU67567.1 hypothetical protein QIU19_08350 [Capnocytophaga canimorsus]WGU71310.1 hypothetical protein QIU18_05425 [Capnocytophaga canimorsus]
MKRILVSQNENNNGTDYIVIDGKLENSDEVIRQVSKKIFSTDNWRRIHKDDFLEMKKNGNELLLKSYYKDKDIAGRSIYYLYMVENNDDIDSVLHFLEKDSEVINRNIDKERTLQIVEHIKSDNKLRNIIIYTLLVIIALSSVVVLLTKIFTNE